VTPLVLALDATGAHGSLALVRGPEVLEEILLDSPDGFAHVIHRAIESILARHHVALRDIDAFASASGPGSFTGVRIGLAAVKGLAEALSKPAFGVSNLQALAWFGTSPLRATLIDARRSEVYGAVYDSAGRLTAAETVGPLDRWLASLPSASPQNGLEIIAEHAFHPPLDRPVTHAPAALAPAIAAIAASRFAAGERPDPAALDANYVRRSDAELFWKE
jgi:tRNA threonylcarbamoyladenosine biosynthesis protein TsaB